jgi:hypothetical protein
MAINFDTLLTVGQERFNPASKDRVDIKISKFVYHNVMVHYKIKALPEIGEKQSDGVMTTV